MPKDIKILDFGCGSGIASKPLHDIGFTNIHGIDGSEGLLKIAETKGIFQTLKKHWVGKDTLP